MKFTLHEIKLWFKSENVEPKSYLFLPDKVNVVTGNATTGKTSFWSIIDYCFLSNELNIPNKIYEKIEWFGIRFEINDKEMCIVRGTPERGAVSANLYYSNGGLPNIPYANFKIADVKSILDKEFGIDDDLKYPMGKTNGRVSFNLSYRYFLLFNALTETVIGAPKTYFDTVFYGKDEYDDVLNYIFDLVVGVNDMTKLKAIEQLKEIELKIKGILSQEKKNLRASKTFENGIINLTNKCAEYELIDVLDVSDNIDKATLVIEKLLQKEIMISEEWNHISELDILNDRYRELRVQINSLNQYNKEFETYKSNLKRSADSLLPIEFLKSKLSDQLVDSYEMKLFIDILSDSLQEIKEIVPLEPVQPLDVTSSVQSLQEQSIELRNKIIQLDTIKKELAFEGRKLISLGSIKFAYEQILTKKKLNPIDVNLLANLEKEKKDLEELSDVETIKFAMNTMLNQCIQRNYDLLESLPTYSNFRTKFDTREMNLKLYPPENQFQFPLDNVGSKSNYMFMHLCFYLGLHEHMIKIGQTHVPQFLFIDQPSIPYYSGRDSQGNDDETKLIDAFKLINSFVDYIVREKKNHFQIFMVEHASKKNWEENNLMYFHTVDEFIDGKGLIPQKAYGG